MGLFSDHLYSMIVDYDVDDPYGAYVLAEQWDSETNNTGMYVAAFSDEESHNNTGLLSINRYTESATHRAHAIHTMIFDLLGSLPIE